MADLPKELQVLVDKDQIRDLLMQYCRGVDRCDAALMSSLFHEDGTAFGSSAWEFCDHFVPENEADTTFTVHMTGNIVIEVDADRANTETYFVTWVGREEDGREYVDAFCGRYVDKWERREGRWGVTVRRTVHEWSRANVAGLEAFPVPESEEGTFYSPVRGRDDIAFDR
jgi:hypothetical protein